MVEFLLDTLYLKLLISGLLRAFFENHEWMLNLLNAFSEAIEIIISFFSLNIFIEKPFTFLRLELN